MSIASEITRLTGLRDDLVDKIEEIDGHSGNPLPTDLQGCVDYIDQMQVVNYVEATPQSLPYTYQTAGQLIRHGVTINADPMLQPGNIAYGTTIFGVAGAYTGDGLYYVGPSGGTPERTSLTFYNITYSPQEVLLTNYLPHNSSQNQCVVFVHLFLSYSELVMYEGVALYGSVLNMISIGDQSKDLSYTYDSENHSITFTCNTSYNFNGFYSLYIKI